LAAKNKKVQTGKSVERILIITEKPSVAKDFVQALPGKFKNNKTFFEGEKYIISFAVGHLVTICTPPEINEIHKTWSLDNLPILPEVFPLKALQNAKTQLGVLKKLIGRKDVVEVINGCDAGREGELIFRYILTYLNSKKLKGKKLSRIWLQSMTKDSIRNGLDNLLADEEMKNLGEAAVSRSEADWLVGINGSRALTSFKSRFGGFRLTPSGRVQTPTLSMIINREKERNIFVSKDFWEIEATFQIKSGEYTGKWKDEKFKKEENNPHSRPERIWNKAVGENILKKCENKFGSVTETSRSSSQSCPLLYDITSLQREANTRFGLSAKGTLDIVQRLYDVHKMVTYPRTGSRHLPEDYISIVKKSIKACSAGLFGKHADEIIKKNWIKPNKKIFDNTRISDHHAIIPTTVQLGNLNDFERKIYTMILQRFLAIFYPVAKFQNTSRLTKVEGETFKTEGKVLEQAGWRSVYGIDSKDESILTPLANESKAKALNFNFNKSETKPPPRFTESTLLSMMESAGKLVEDEELREAMKDMGLGTPATRASIIEGLIKDKYVVRQAKELVPSAKAFELLEVIYAMNIEELTSPELTGAWEHKLDLIAEGKLERKEFMQGIVALVESIVKKVKDFDETAEKNKKVAFVDRPSGKKVYETVSFYETEDESIKIRKFLGGRFITHEEVQTLLIEKKLGPLSGFISKAGKSFSAMIKMKEDGKVEFVFEDPSDSRPDFNTLEYIGISPVDESKVYRGEISYVSESYYTKDSKTGLKINRIILGKELTPDIIKAMLTGKKTKLLKGFKSSKTKRFFDAYLALDNKGKISFSFPPRGFGKQLKKKREKTES